MKSILAVTALAALAIGCDQQRQGSPGQAQQSERDTVQRTVRDAKSEVDKQAEAQKKILDSEAKAAEAKLDAEKARAQAQSSDAQQKVEQASQAIRNAGNTGNQPQTQTGAEQSGATPPPSVTPPATTLPATTPPTPGAASAAGESDQKLTEQVRTAVVGQGPEAGNAQTIQVSVSGGAVTLSGTVKSEAEKSQAEQKAKAVSGVTRVDNQLQVKSE